jgi:hypothetical protein
MKRFWCIVSVLSLSLCSAIAVNLYAADIMITITLDDTSGKASAALNDFVTHYGWTATIPNPANPGMTIANPETRAQAIKRLLQAHILASAKARRVTIANEEARKKEADVADTEIKFK